MSGNWDFYFARMNDKAVSIFLDLRVADSAPDAERPWLLLVRVYFTKPQPNGFHGSEEADTLFRIADSLEEAAGGAVGATLVGRITGDGSRTYYFYAPTFLGFDDAVTRTMTGFPEYLWESQCEMDPEWKQFRRVLYPTARDWQRIKNRHVIEALQKEGDSLRKARLVSHWAYFQSESGQREFSAEVMDRGFKVSNVRRIDGALSTTPWGVAFERVDHVDWDSINSVTIELHELAQSYSGEYDGWETSVERANE